MLLRIAERKQARVGVVREDDRRLLALYRAHHNLDRAVEALTLWRGDNPDYADIVYATEQVSKEEQLWPVRT